jgi:hypothetical protein
LFAFELSLPMLEDAAAGAAAAVFNGDCFTQYTTLSTNSLDYFLQATDAMVLGICGSEGGKWLQNTAVARLHLLLKAIIAALQTHVAHGMASSPASRALFCSTCTAAAPMLSLQDNSMYVHMLWTLGSCALEAIS